MCPVTAVGAIRRRWVVKTGPPLGPVPPPVNSDGLGGEKGTNG